MKSRMTVAVLFLLVAFTLHEVVPVEAEAAPPILTVKAIGRVTGRALVDGHVVVVISAEVEGYGEATDNETDVGAIASLSATSYNAAVKEAIRQLAQDTIGSPVLITQVIFEGAAI